VAERDTYQLIRDLNMVSAGIIASYFLEVMRSWRGPRPPRPGGPGQPSLPERPRDLCDHRGLRGAHPGVLGKVLPIASRLQILQPAAGGLILVRCSAHLGGRPTNRGEPTSHGWPARARPSSHAQSALRRYRICISGPVDRRAETPLELDMRTADSVAA